MPSRPKFTQAARQSVLAALRAGASLRQAAQLAGVSHTAVRKWLARGRISEPGGNYYDFFKAVWELTHPGEGDAPVVPPGTGRRLSPELKARIDAWYAQRIADIAERVGVSVEEVRRWGDST